MSVIPRPPDTDTLTPRVTGACWTEGCEEPIAVPPMRVTYWCERHDRERRERIKAAMAKIENDSYGIPRNHGAPAHEVTIHAGHNMIRNRDFWWWKCTCGQESQAESRNEGIAKSAGKRHVTGATRRAA